MYLFLLRSKCLIKLIIWIILLYLIYNMNGDRKKKHWTEADTILELLW